MFHPSFVVHVLVIVGYAAGEQVVWIDAGRIIAVMANALSFLDFAVVQSIGISVSVKLFLSSNGENPVSVDGKATSPYPAFASFAYSHPKAIYLGKNWTRVVSFDVFLGDSADNGCFAPATA